jgi:hypothetical protein
LKGEDLTQPGLEASVTASSPSGGAVVSPAAAPARPPRGLRPPPRTAPRAPPGPRPAGGWRPGRGSPGRPPSCAGCGRAPPPSGPTRAGTGRCPHATPASASRSSWSPPVWPDLPGTGRTVGRVTQCPAGSRSRPHSTAFYEAASACSGQHSTARDHREEFWARPAAQCGVRSRRPGRACYHRHASGRGLIRGTELTTSLRGCSRRVPSNRAGTCARHRLNSAGDVARVPAPPRAGIIGAADRSHRLKGSP